MKKHVRFITLMLALTLLATLTSCWLLEEPFGEGAEETTLSYDDVPIGEVDTHTHTAGETELGTDVLETAPPAPDIRTLWGTVVEYTAEEPMEGVIAVRVNSDGVGETLHLLVENPSDFCLGDVVEFTYDAGRPMDSFDGDPVWEAISIGYVPIAVPEKPVIYFYPEISTEVSVKLTIDGELTCTYPAYGKGWDNFVAHPDGTLVFPNGKQYYCLYWEGIQDMDCDFSKSFCVKGEDTAAFLEWVLAEQGLTPREANEFIIYWLPRMEQNPYNVIAFQTEAYTEGAVLDIQPSPDSLLRVFMAWYPSDVAVEMEAQELISVERSGFTVVEWGGCELDRP